MCFAGEPFCAAGVRAGCAWIRRGRIALVLPFVIAGCGGSSDVTPIAAERGAITAGVDDDADDGVVALQYAGAVQCTGVLVSPASVITAAHCATPRAPSQVLFGPVPGAPRATLAISEVRVHPKFDPDTLENDVAVLALAHDAPPDVLPFELASPETSLMTGAAVVLVGYGSVGPGQPDASLRRRKGQSEIGDILASSFGVVPAPSLPCGGDSGGAGLLASRGRPVLVGVISSGDASCQSGARLVRIDAVRSDFVDPALAIEPSAGPESATTGCSLSDAPPRRTGHGAWLAFALFCCAIVRAARTGRAVGRPASMECAAD